MKDRLRDETGAVLALVGALVAASVFLGILALVIDGGALYLERRTVSNAAESGALSLARLCADQPNTCVSSSIAQEMANADSPDGATKVTEVCVSGKTPSGSTCLTPTGTKLDCTPVPNGVSSYARVRTETLSNEPGGGISALFDFGQTNSLKACAQARWGNASSAAVYSPFAISICEWARQQSLPRVLTEFNTNSGVSDCTYTFTDQSGMTYTKSGINGWAALDLMSSTLPDGAKASVACPNPATDQPAYLRIGYQLNQITRDQSSSNYCGNSDLVSKMSNWLNQTLYLPLVSTAKLSGNATVHTIEAFAAFKLYGYSLLKGNGSSTNMGGTVPSGSWCPKNTNCIYGEFIKTISPDSEISTGSGVPNVGIQAIELI